MNNLKRKPLYLVGTIVLVSALVIGVVVAVSRNTASKTSLQSGIKGTTVVDGGCPVVRDDTPCPNKLLAANIIVTNADGGTAATAKSDADGHFRVSLPQGTYTVRATNATGAPYPASSPEQVKVTSGAFTDMTIHFDSGIR